MTPSGKGPRQGVPDPLADGHVEGQNPSTPERMPGHTAFFSDDEKSPLLSTEPLLDGRPAFVLASGETYGITFDSSGNNLPPRPDGGTWILVQYASTSKDELGALGLDPLAAARDMAAVGFHIWTREPGASVSP